MLSLYTAEQMLAALNQPLRSELRTLLTSRVQHTLDHGLAELTHIVVIESGDTEEQVVAEIGFSPLVSRIDGQRFGDPDFEPDWDWRVDIGPWCELTYTVGNAGFAYILIISSSGEQARLQDSTSQ